MPYTGTDDKQTFEDDEIPTFDESGTDLDPLEDDEVCV